MRQLSRTNNKSVLQGSPVSVLCIISLLCYSKVDEESTRPGRERSRGNTRGRSCVVSIVL